MSFLHDRQVKGYCLFLLFFAGLLLALGLAMSAMQAGAVRALYLDRSRAIAAALLEQGVPKTAVAAALACTQASAAGDALLAELGITARTEPRLLPFLSRFQPVSLCAAGLLALALILVLFAGTAVFLTKRDRLYRQAGEGIGRYLNGDYSRPLPQGREGTLFQLFSAAEQLATALQSKNEAERRSKEFLKSTISDISHQLKTPLAALTLYQEIIGGEAGNADTVREFALKSGAALKRMERLIRSLLKLARLDAGNIVFDRKAYPVTELAAYALSELTARAEAEEKTLLVEGDPGLKLACDLEWTGEAIGNLVQNALDHTGPGGVVRLAWEQRPALLRITVCDNGSGIAPEDIHHIFKRFYRSRRSLDTQGIGLGLPLAKAIVEGQGGTISVQSGENEGTAFTLAFLTES